MDNLPKFALSIRQPWAYAILHCGKDIENRPWTTSFRGPFCIHAAKGYQKDEYAEAAEFIEKISGKVVPPIDELPRGGIVGKARLSGTIRESESPWFVGKIGFILKDVQPVEFIAVRGVLNIFEWRKYIIDVSTLEPVKPAQADLFEGAE